ncbi:MAG: hypothetical protein WC997_17870 [Porticoccaceae bacterium]
MSYTDFEPLKPDPTTDDGTAVFVHTRENLLWLRDAAISGALMGWQLAVSGGTPAQPAQWLYSKGNERVRLTITWGTSGGPKGKPQSMVVDYSSDNGTTWLAIGTATITYDAQGNFTGSTGIAPGLAAHWLMGLPERVRLIEAAVQGFGSMAGQAANDVNITGGSITGISDLAISDGGTGASTASDARVALGANNASNLTQGTLPVARLGSSGERTADTVLHGDNTWREPKSSFGPQPVIDLGDVGLSGSETVELDLSAADFFLMSMQNANTAGTLTLDFTSLPDTTDQRLSWHVRLQRGGRKGALAFAQTVDWSGGVAPPLGTTPGRWDLLMFYKLGSENIRAMLVDWA